MSLATALQLCSPVLDAFLTGGDIMYLQCASAREANDTTDGPRRIQGERVRDHDTARALD